MSKVLVTGGAGFIGAHVTRELLNTEHDVVVIDDLSGGFESNVDSRAKFIRADICDYRHMSQLFNGHNFEYVFHLAAYAAEGLSHFIKRFNYSNNLIGSVNLINESVKHGVKCFVFTSSIAVYGTNQTPMREDMVPCPEDPYGIAKYAIEMELKATKEMFGLPYIIFRPHNVYGELQNIGDKYRNVIGIFMNQLMQGQKMTIFGDGLQTRAFTYISDVAKIIVKSIYESKAYNQVFNIGGEKVYTVKYLAEAVANVMGYDANIKYLDVRQEVKHAFCDHEKIKNVFKIKKFVSLEKGLTNMAEWARSVGPRKSKPFKYIEIEKNMPLSWLEVK
jgi:UDP-glucose 4-epimerase